MLNDKKIRLATEDDSDSLLEIYAPYITNTTYTFEYDIPTIMEFKERIAKIRKYYPWLVCEINKRIAGYAYASRFREREAYKWSVSLSIYINQDHHRRGIGRALYFALIELLRLQGFYNAYVAVTVPNIKSERFHEAFGFKEVGVYHKAGYKFDSWHDVKCYELKIQEHSLSPIEPRTIDEISNTGEFRVIIEKAEQMIRE